MSDFPLNLFLTIASNASFVITSHRFDQAVVQMLGNVLLHKDLEHAMGVDISSSSSSSSGGGGGGGGSSSSSSADRAVFIARVAAMHCGLDLTPAQVNRKPASMSLLTLTPPLPPPPPPELLPRHRLDSPFRGTYSQVFCHTLPY
jgi:hypothetical protein